MKKDKMQIKKLLELEHLVNTKGDPARIAELRKELGVKEPKREEVDTKLAKQYFRLRAFGLNEREIAYALVTSNNALNRMRDSFTEEEIEERLEAHKENNIVMNYMKQLEKRFQSSLHWRLRKLGKRAYDNS